MCQSIKYRNVANLNTLIDYDITVIPLDQEIEGVVLKDYDSIIIGDLMRK